MDILTEILTAVQGNSGTEKLKDLVVKKRLQVIAAHKEMLKDNEEYNNSFKRLNVQVNQDNELLETEFNKSDCSPYETLKEYYKLTIGELKEQIKELKGRIEKGDKREVLEMSPVKDAQVEHELEKALENNHIMVSGLEM